MERRAGFELVAWEPRTRLTLLSGLGAVLTLAGYTVIGGAVGAGVGLGLVAAITVFEGPIWFAIAQLPLLFVNATPVEMGFLEITFLPVLFAPFVRGAVSKSLLLAAFGLTIGVSIIAAVLLSQISALWLVAILITAIITLSAYILHRYELLQLGLVQEDLE